MEIGNRKIEIGKWNLENGNWNLENGNQKHEVAWHLSAFNKAWNLCQAWVDAWVKFLCVDHV